MLWNGRENGCNGQMIGSRQAKRQRMRSLKKQRLKSMIQKTRAGLSAL